MFCLFTPGLGLVSTKTIKDTAGGGTLVCEITITLPGLVACQYKIAIIEQSRQRVADSGPVLISKGVGAQIDIGPSEGLL